MVRTLSYVGISAHTALELLLLPESLRIGHRADDVEVQTPQPRIMKLGMKPRERYDVRRLSPQRWADREEARGSALTAGAS